MKCSFSRLLYPKTVEEARDGKLYDRTVQAP